MYRHLFVDVVDRADGERALGVAGPGDVGVSADNLGREGVHLEVQVAPRVAAVRASRVVLRECDLHFLEARVEPVRGERGRPVQVHDGLGDRAELEGAVRGAVVAAAAVVVVVDGGGGRAAGVVVGGVVQVVRCERTAARIQDAAAGGAVSTSAERPAPRGTPPRSCTAGCPRREGRGGGEDVDVDEDEDEDDLNLFHARIRGAPRVRRERREREKDVRVRR